jgi:AraC family transcriptional regulator, regulatory protein of adaptative response / DNA-3-methyladenine glycosylase II
MEQMIPTGLPSPDACYAAVKARDTRFDGRFFTGVTSTGVYCRPICPARLPLRKNCTFHASAAAAESAGFRACLRCRPEAAPGTPAARGSEATVSRALKLIGEGALDEGSVTDLADRLGLGERQVRRLFVAHLGANPEAVAATRRLLLANQLLRDTSLPISDIAFASGFSSLRRFNDAFAKRYKEPHSRHRPDRHARDRCQVHG